MAGMCRRGIRSVGTAGQLLSCLMIVVFSAFVATSQETDPFPNLFRGRNRGSQKRANKSLVVRKRDYLREGTLLRLDPDIWVQDEIDLTLFPTNEEDDDDDTLLVRRFRQNPKDQPTPNQFFGKLVDLDNDRESDFITLVNTTAASSKLSVITGTIHIEGSVYQIRQLPSGEILVENRGKDSDFEEEIEIEEDDNGDDTPNVTAKQGKDSLELHSPLDRRRRVAVDSNASVLPYDINRRQMQQGTDDGSQLDIMVVYSRNAMCAAARHFNNKCVASAENKATIEGIIELAIKEANEAFESSGIDTSLRLVHVHYEDNYDDTAYDWPTVFTHYTGVNDGRLDYIHPMRDQYGADFVSFFVNTRGYCGSAHRPPEPREDRAFSMVRWDCATGHYTFAHELSHNLGCRHDRENANTPSVAGDYNFGYQYVPATSGESWRTLLAYNCPNGCPRLLRYSTPLLTRNGIPLGSEQEDNARFIRERLSIYANFRPSVVGAEEDPPRPQVAAPKPSSTNDYPEGTNELETVTRPGVLIGAAGNMFDVVAKKDLKITGFAVTAFAATTVTVEIYKLKNLGTFVGQEYNPGAWTLIGGATMQTKADEPTNLPPGSLRSGVTVQQGTTQAFYITYQANSNYNRYTRAAELGRIYAQNDDIQFKVGYTVNYPFQFHPKAPRVFNGKILYEVLPTSSSTDAPTAGPDIPSGKNNALSTDLALSDSVSSFLTTFVSNNGHSGNLFTIEAKEVDIIVETFAVHTASTNDNLKLKIYTKFGNFSRQDGDPSIAWTEIADTTVEGLGEFQPTHVPSKDVQSILMKANTRQSFYITFTGPYIKYTSALIDPNIIQNDHLRFLASAGTQFPFHYYFPNRIWNGVVYYKVGDDGSADLQGSDTAIEDGDSSQGEGPSNVADNPIWSSASVAPRSSP